MIVASPTPSEAPTVGLVLGAGGVLGAAWLTGALHAIATETGWDPGSADYVVGTSAGAMIGALIACGVPPWYMLSAGSAASSAADAGPPGGRGALNAARRRAGALGPGSWRLAASSLARPYRYSPAALLSGWLPRGIVSTEPLKQTVRSACSAPWAPHPNYWAIAMNYRTGQRVAFGRADGPHAELPDAVAASCAVPGYFAAVEIDGVRYVDGGVISVSSLDVLARARPQLVIALNPMSSLHAGAPRTLGERVAYAVRQACGRRLGSEAARMRALGSEVLLIQPTVHDLDAMGTNLMSASRREQVLQTASQTVAAHLRETPVGERLSLLPPGVPELVRRPPRARRMPPDVAALARARWERAAAPAAR